MAQAADATGEQAAEAAAAEPGQARSAVPFLLKVQKQLAWSDFQRLVHSEVSDNRMHTLLVSGDIGVFYTDRVKTRLGYAASNLANWRPFGFANEPKDFYHVVHYCVDVFFVLSFGYEPPWLCHSLDFRSVLVRLVGCEVIGKHWVVELAVPDGPPHILARLQPTGSVEGAKFILYLLESGQRPRAALI